jgi:hypothetical protein
VGKGTNGVVVSAVISNLLSGTDYHFRLVATNRAGITWGADRLFSTDPQVLPPTLGPCVLLPNRQFQFEFTATAGARFTVLASTNLVDWEVLGPANEVQPGVFQFADPAAPNQPWCFYHVRSP